jgi:hypothetical protein
MVSLTLNERRFLQHEIQYGWLVPLSQAETVSRQCTYFEFDVCKDAWKGSRVSDLA